MVPVAPKWDTNGVRQTILRRGCQFHSETSARTNDLH
jgi:hypothetical protein